MNHRTVLSSIVLASAVLAAPAAFAQGRGVSIDAPTHAQLTMAQAVVIAEWMGNGRATRVRLGSKARDPSIVSP